MTIAMAQRTMVYSAMGDDVSDDNVDGNGATGDDDVDGNGATGDNNDDDVNNVTHDMDSWG